MQTFFLYFFKLSISLGLVYIFYQLLLRRLTFYNHNRWYLLGYSLLCFVIPLIDISPALDKGTPWKNDLVGLIPVVSDFTANHELNLSTPYPATWGLMLVVFLTGVVVMVGRLVIQFISFLHLRRTATLISGDQVKFYQVDKDIIPFSFGKSIFVNQSLHTAPELREIIRHEFVHIKQRHSIDILIAEIVCILNWYNPFAWLIRGAIRQNLEFIADHRVLANGMDRKQYQYLLLKVIGNNQFSIVNPFNFSSLKNRIVMMNKMKTARIHLTRFLFILPLLAVVLLSFRSATLEEHAIVEKIETNRIVVNPVSPVSQALLNGDTSKPSRKTSAVIATPAKEKTAGAVEATKPGSIKIVSVNESNKPHIVVDGVDWPAGLDIDMIDASRIESMQVWKDSEAKRQYGEKGKNGVIIVTTKKATAMKIPGDGTPANLLYFIDGKSVTKEAVESLDPKKIKSVNVLKGKAAADKYGQDAKAGAVEIQTEARQQINYIEQKSVPVIDVRSVLIGKRPQEC